MVIAIDYDGTLSTKKVQAFAKKAIMERHDVWVVTKRREGVHNADMMEVLKSVRLPPQKVIYTDGRSKYEFVTALRPDIIIDNETDYYEDIQNHTSTLPLIFTNY